MGVTKAGWISGLALWLCLGSVTATENPPPLLLTLTDAELEWVGERVFLNECAGRYDCLVHWNEGEAFPSLGIGHFIWYPKGVRGRFVESFPDLVRYMRERSLSVPGWLADEPVPNAPWPDREAFLAGADSDRVKRLRGFLADTKGIQAGFIVGRARASLDKVVAAAPGHQQEVIRQRLAALSSSPGGAYALIDYVNFKGEGLSPQERYNDQGWGLLQVLQDMSESPGRPVLDGFRDAAARVLTRRASNAENAIERERWLPGWLKRLETYREPVTQSS